MDSPIITLTIYTGSKGKELFVHRELLLKTASSFFDRKVRPQESLHTGDTFKKAHFYDYHYQIYRLFVDWLYRKDLPTTKNHDIETANREAEHYTKLYLLAATYKIPKLQNIIMDRLR